ncbi:MAG: rhomboid family intramembrane serine protease, partial [Planctomycetota bacterium]
MIVFFPWEVDVPQERTPYANYCLIGSIVVVSLAQFVLLFMITSGRYVHNPVKIERLSSFLGGLNTFVLDGYSLPGLIGHIWLHGGIIHLLGNMWFLWVFGNAVCAKVGNGYYAVIFLLVGIFSAVTHLVF